MLFEQVTSHVNYGLLYKYLINQVRRILNLFVNEKRPNKFQILEQVFYVARKVKKRGFFIESIGQMQTRLSVELIGVAFVCKVLDFPKKALIGLIDRYLEYFDLLDRKIQMIQSISNKRESQKHIFI